MVSSIKLAKSGYIKILDCVLPIERLPPRRLQLLVGADDFEKSAYITLLQFISAGRLKPDETILDIGCGCGRIAFPLSTAFGFTGEYFGFDIHKESIVWCQENITKEFPNFAFIHSDIYNSVYNPVGVITPENYVFPFPDKKFDCIFLNSVFTHMLPESMEQYVSEMVRTLKDTGRCYVTFFLLNAESKGLQKTKEQIFKFIYGDGVYCTVDPVFKEAAIAYNEDFVRNLFAKYGLKIDTIYYGSWCGREKCIGYQDIVIARKQT